MAGPQLTEKQRKLVDAYVVSGECIASGREAGYSGHDRSVAATVSKTLRKPHVRTYLAQRRAETRKKFELSAEAFFEALYELGIDTSIEAAVRRDCLLGALDRMGFMPVDRRDLTVRAGDGEPVDGAVLLDALSDRIQRLPSSVLERMRGSLPTNGTAKRRKDG